MLPGLQTLQCASHKQPQCNCQNQDISLQHQITLRPHSSNVPTASFRAEVQFRSRVAFSPNLSLTLMTWCSERSQAVLWNVPRFALPGVSSRCTLGSHPLPKVSQKAAGAPGVLSGGTWFHFVPLTSDLSMDRFTKEKRAILLCEAPFTPSHLKKFAWDGAFFVCFKWEGKITTD